MEQINAVFQEAGNPLEVTTTVNSAKNVSHSLTARKDYYIRAAKEANMSLGFLNRLVFETFQDDIKRWNYSFGVYN